MNWLAFWFWNDEKLLLLGVTGAQFCHTEQGLVHGYTDLLQGPGLVSASKGQPPGIKKKKIFKTQWKEEEGKSLNRETICASSLCRFIFPIPHILQMLQYNSYIWGEEKKNNKTQYFIKQIIYIDMKNWILFFFFEKKKKTKITFVCVWKLLVSAALARWVSFPHYSPGLRVGVHPTSGSLVGTLLCGFCHGLRLYKGKELKEAKSKNF